MAARLSVKTLTIFGGERLPATIHVTPRATRLRIREGGVQHQNALPGPAVELATRRARWNPGRSAASTSNMRRARDRGRPAVSGRKCKAIGVTGSFGIGVLPENDHACTAPGATETQVHGTGRLERWEGPPDTPARTHSATASARNSACPPRQHGRPTADGSVWRAQRRDPAAVTRKAPAASATPGSSARMNASPTRKVWTPAKRMR